jgi:hypothetical protein
VKLTSSFELMQPGRYRRRASRAASAAKRNGAAMASSPTPAAEQAALDVHLDAVTLLKRPNSSKRAVAVCRP